MGKVPGGSSRVQVNMCAVERCDNPEGVSFGRVAILTTEEATNRDTFPIDLYAWRGIMPNEPITDGFKEYIYNDILKRVNKGVGAFSGSGMIESEKASTHPNVIPQKYFKVVSAGVRTLPTEPLGCCPHLTETPKIDGRLNDPSWKQAAYYTDLRAVKSGTDSNCRTEVFLFRDAQALYFAFRCEDPLLTKRRINDDNVYPKRKEALSLHAMREGFKKGGADMPIALHRVRRYRRCCPSTVGRCFQDADIDGASL